MKRLLQLAVSVVLSLLFIGLSLRGTQLAEVGRAMAGADPLLVGLSALVLVAIHLVRVWRWGLLVRPLAPVPFRDLNAFTAVGFMALMVLPLRLGEFVRPMLVASHGNVRRSAALAGIVVERVIDGLFMGLLLVVLLWTLGGQLSGDSVAYVRTGGQLVSVGFGAALVALWAAVRHRRTAERFLTATIGRVAPGVGRRVVELLGHFTDGLAALPSLGRMVPFLALTVLVWGLNALGLWLLARAFSLQLSALQALTVLGLQVIGAMIPAGPGMVGTHQFFTRMGVGLFVTGAAATASIAGFAHTGWLLAFVQQVAFGLWFVVLGRVKLQEALGLGRAANETATAPIDLPAAP